MAPAENMTLSSPDPLGMSNGNIPSHSPTKADHRTLNSPRKALTEASGNAQVQEFYINTPPNPRRNPSLVKSPRQATQSTSPWRIRLTVQAEPVDDLQRSENPVGKRLTERTTTITVPLKGGDDTPPAVKKGRGRPRKSLDSPVKRAGTPKPKPKPKAGGRRKTMPQSPNRLEEAHVETVTPPTKPRGRPRKSVGPNQKLSQDDEVDVWLGSSLAEGGEVAETVTKSTRTRSRGRRQEITPMKMAMDSDTESQSSSAGIAGDVPEELAWTLGKRHDERDQLDQRISESYEAPTPQIEQSLLLGTSREQSNLVGDHDEELWRSMIHRDTRSLSPLGDDEQDPVDSDPTGQHEEYDSILESEGFSMVSVSSLPSVGDNSISLPQRYGSPNEQAPAIMSSPLVPPALETAKFQSSPRQLEKPSDGTPKVARVVRAGIALQGALSPKDRSQKLNSPFQESHKPSPFLTVERPAPQRELLHPVPKDESLEEYLDDLYRGFGAGTRRELRAGLRLGEELAKRQRSNRESIAGARGGDDVFQHTVSPKYPELPASKTKERYSLKAPGSENQVRYPLLSNHQLPSPERSVIDEEDRMSWKADTPIKQEEPGVASAQILVDDESIGPDASAIDYTQMAREEEWQQEREAVSKQIEMANKSQVIVIDSDEEEEEEREPKEGLADCDIWQAEAQSADQSRETTPEASDILLQPEVVKPRRSKLPSPWRRNSEVIYSDEVETTEWDLSWQPDQSQARSSKKRNTRNEQTQDPSDTTAESVLDISFENTRKAEAQIQSEASKVWPTDRSLYSIDEDSNAATSAEHTLDHGSITETDQITRSSIIAAPGENQGLTELPPTPKEASMINIMEVSEKTTSLNVTEGTEGTSFEASSRASKDSKAAVDPRLLQKKTRLPRASYHPIRPIQPLHSTQSSTSWVSRLTAPIWSVFAPAAPLQPAATKEDILCSSPYEPLCQLTPWEECHFRALGPLYYGSLLYGAHLFPFNPRSAAGRYCGAYVTTKLGWSRKITPEDCGITDAFMVLLDERGFALGEPGARWIDEGIVIARCVTLWVGMVKKGEIEVDGSKEEKIGLRDQGDRKWTKNDIDWANNRSAYFERKRREFDGLPSWKNKA